MAKKGLEKYVEETYDKLTPEQKEAFEKHLKYSSSESRRKMKHHEFEKLGAGTEAFFRQVYESTKVHATKEKLIGKNDDDSIAQVLEKYVLDALSQLGVKEKDDAEWYKARLDSKKFEGPKQRMEELLRIANKHFGVSQQEWNQLVGSLKSGEEDQFYEALNHLSGTLADRLIQLRVQKHAETTVEKHGEKAFNVYTIKEMQDKFKYRIKKQELHDVLDSSILENAQRYHGAKRFYEKKHLKSLHLEEAPKKEYQNAA